jgi:hypothetical protein
LGRLCLGRRVDYRDLPMIAQDQEPAGMPDQLDKSSVIS